jgi:hypothetical protein
MNNDILLYGLSFFVEDPSVLDVSSPCESPTMTLLFIEVLTSEVPFSDPSLDSSLGVSSGGVPS